MCIDRSIYIAAAVFIFFVFIVFGRKLSWSREEAAQLSEFGVSIGNRVRYTAKYLNSKDVRVTRAPGGGINVYVPQLNKNGDKIGQICIQGANVSVIYYKIY